MDHDLLVDQQLLQLEDGKEVHLDYYLTQSTRENDVVVYGIKVDKRGDMFETEMTGPISYSKEWVLRVCKKLANHQVTPMVLINIVDDIITAS